MAAVRIQPVILSGGAGTRLWPLSRALYPKQFFPLVSELSLLQDTARRVSDPALFLPPVVVCNHEHRFIVAEQLREIGLAAREIVLEPAARNTGAACAAAALLLAEEDPLLLVLPSDHAIADEPAFRAAVEAAAAAAESGALVTFGIAPARPETGYGYIERGAALEYPGCFKIARFKEKPDAATAAQMLAAGNWSWNSGMFLFRASALLAEMGRFAPEVVATCRAALEKSRRDLDFLRLDETAFAKCPSISIDYAVMEKTDRAAVVPAEMGWSDVGSWTALWETGAQDVAGNVLKGDVTVSDVRNCYIHSEDRLVAAIGLADMTLVVTDDAVLAAPRARAQEVKALVESLVASGRSEPVTHSRVYRPWGSYQSIDTGERFQVKHITVNPGAKLSLQRHRHRAEHWVVVNGTARVTRGEQTLILHENESTYIPAGMAHRLENPGPGPLRLIEVQSGGYLGEDDIERLEDSYGRS
jgi:mannose-1-phosphate guanylyltransferase/mannose-1-phosphate guanylyltransferase/mannose-6-phosphate isomerase